MKEGEAGEQSKARTRTFETRLTRTLNLIPKALGAMKEIKVSLFELIQVFFKKSLWLLGVAEKWILEEQNGIRETG